jgi:hypothetical protein
VTLQACIWPVYRDQVRPMRRFGCPLGLPFSYLRDFSDRFLTLDVSHVEVNEIDTLPTPLHNQR